MAAIRKETYYHNWTTSGEYETTLNRKRKQITGEAVVMSDPLLPNIHQGMKKKDPPAFWEDAEGRKSSGRTRQLDNSVSVREGSINKYKKKSGRPS